MTINRQFVLIITCVVGALSAGFALSSLAGDPTTPQIADRGQAAPATDRVASSTPELSSISGEGPLEPLDPLSTHRRTSLTVVEQLRNEHYLHRDLDDETSSATFDNYLESLDGTKSYLLASDIEEFEKHRYLVDDALKRGELDVAFDMFNRYQSRVVERLESIIAQLDGGLKDLSFDVEEQLELDREHAAWPASQAELDELWRKRLKNSVLGMKLNGKDLDEITTLLKKRYRNRLKQAKLIRSEDAFQVYMNAFAATYDPHTQYLSPRTSETFNINMSLSLEGIGAVLRTEDDYTEVVSVVTAGPADKSGKVRPSDKIISVAQGDRGEMIDVVGWRLDDVVELIRGPKGSVVRLEVIPSENEDSGVSIEVRVVREAVQLEDQSAQKKVLSLTRAGRTHKIGIIEVPTFYVDIRALQRRDPNYKSTTRDVRRLIGELKEEGVEALVIDLRNNGGGSLQEADSLTGLFIKSGPTVQVKQARRRASVYSDRDDELAWDGPMAVLVNRLSASASEIFAGALQDYGRALVIGSQTFGKGTVQTLIPMDRGQLKLTQAKFYRISGQSTQHQGVLPDIAFPELYDIERIGESSLDDALPWDVIQPAIYDDYGNFDPLLESLTRQHKQRTASDPDFNYLRELSQRSQENRAKTHVSLREATRIAEKAGDDEWRLGLENQLRTAKGEDPIKDLDELDDADDEELTPEDDAMVKETGNILLDFISLEQQVAAVERPTTTAVQ